MKKYGVGRGGGADKKKSKKKKKNNRLVLIKLSRNRFHCNWQLSFLRALALSYERTTARQQIVFSCFRMPYFIRSYLGWSGGAMVLGKLPVPGRPTNLDNSRARAYCACSRCGWGLFGHFYSHLSFLFLSPSLGDGPI